MNSTSPDAASRNATLREAAEILLVDDDVLALTATSAALDMAGYIVHQARDRQTALKAARTLALDLVICDINLAGESGLELCRDLRKLPGLEDVPMMFVSATQLPDIVRRSHEAGGAYYLRKPLDPDVLVELVDKALWLPHLVQSRLAMHEPAVRPVPAPSARPSAATIALTAAITGIRLPQA
jgi:CheY-like chemotaxis protein